MIVKLYVKELAKWVLSTECHQDNNLSSLSLPQNFQSVLSSCKILKRLSKLELKARKWGGGGEELKGESEFHCKIIRLSRKYNIFLYMIKTFVHSMNLKKR